MHANAGSADKTLKVYDGLYHEIFNEPEQEQVLDDSCVARDARAAWTAPRHARPSATDVVLSLAGTRSSAAS